MPQNLIVNISPPKCGTTGLYFALARSQTIAMPVIKEPRYFASGSSHQFRNLPDALKTDGYYHRGEDWWNSLFKDDENALYRLDFTTYYAITKQTPELIHKHYPNARLLFVLRDPIRRFISHYHQYVKMGISMLPLEEIIDGQNEVSELLYKFSDYRGIYQRFRKHFDREQILIIDFEDLANTNHQLEESIKIFLKLSDFKYSPTQSQKNVAGIPRYSSIQSLMFNKNVRFILDFLPINLKTSLLQVRKRVIRANTKDAAYSMPSERFMKILKDRLSDPEAFYRESLRSI